MRLIPDQERIESFWLFGLHGNVGHDGELRAVNSWWQPLGFTLPSTRPSAQWQAEINSYDPAAPAGAAKRHAGDQVTVGPRSIAVLRNPLAAGGSPA